MTSKSYYRILTDADNNFKSDENFLHVNCAGQYFYHHEIKACTSRHDYYMIYLRRGIINVNSPVLERQLSPGDVIIFQPEFNFDYFKPSGIDMEYYWVHFSGYGAAQFLEKCGLETNSIMTPGNREGICDNFHRLFDTFLSRDKFFNIDSEHCLSSLLISIAKFIAGKTTGSTQNYSKINQSLSYIHNNISKPIDISTLAEVEHLSTSHFRAVFHRTTGLSPQEYIILSKLNYSCELMRQTDMNIKEISAAVGYNDPQYFSRIFSKHLGVTPSQYRRKRGQA